MTLRKSVRDSFAAQDAALEPEPSWLPIDRVARVEVTSEDAQAPIDDALLDAGAGWRAGAPGPQSIRLIFDSPQQLRHIELGFVEREIARTQEFTLRWSPDGGRSFHEIVRQQWNFSPSGAVSETEHYRVHLADVTVLELTIVPDVSGGPARAALARWRVA